MGRVGGVRVGEHLVLVIGIDDGLASLAEDVRNLLQNGLRDV